MTALTRRALIVFSLLPVARATAMDARPASERDAGVPDGGAARGILVPPVALSAARPAYPAAAKAAGRAGTVVVRLDVDETGAVTSAQVVSAVDPDLDAAALEAARGIRFQPARDGDRPVRVTIDWRIEFKLSARASPAAPSPAAAADTAPVAEANVVVGEKRGHLQGRVVAKGTRKPVAAATVTVDLTAIGETDADGRFAGSVACGPRSVVVQAPGFDPVTTMLDPCAEVSPLVLRLPPHEHGAVYETVIRARTSLPAITLQTQELTKTPGSLGDPFRALESLPGVGVLMGPLPIYAIRGANPGNTGFFLDDLRVPALFHLLLGPSVIHPYFFDGLDFYPGGYPARHGRYVSGIVSAQTRQPPSDMVHASADVRLFDAGMLVSAPFPDGNGSLAIAGRYSYTAALLSLLTDSVRLSYWDYQLRADRHLGSTRLTLLWFGSHDLLSSSGSNGNTSELVLRFHRVSLGSATPIGQGLLTASIALGLDHSKAPLTDTFPLTIDSRSVTPRLAFRWPTAHADLEVGVDGEFQWSSPLTAVRRAGLLDLASEREARMMAVYVSVPIRAGGRVLVTPEIRLDTYTVNRTTRTDLGPRFSGRLSLDEDRTWISGTGGRFTQTPSLPLQVPGADNFGLAVYGLQTSWQGSLGVGTRRFAGLESTIAGYVQRYLLTDIRDPTFSTIDLLAEDFLVRRDALSYGMEVMLRRPNTQRLHGWLAYTLSQNQRALGGGVIAPSDWDQRHILNLVVGYRMGRYTVGGRAHLHTGRPVLIRDVTPQRYGRLPTFYQIDLRADRRFVFDAFILEIYVELVNATLSREVFALHQGYSSMETSFRVALPSIGVHGEF